MNRWIQASSWIIAITCMLCGAIQISGTQAQEFAGTELAFFEQKVRPLLIKHCYECHSASAQKSKGGLQLDTRDAILSGGDNGPAVVVGQPEQSLLVKAIHYGDADLEMPPDGKLSDREIASLEQWIRSGLAMPPKQPASKAKRTIDIEAGKQHWAFQPLRSISPPQINADASWVANRIDPFILAKQHEHAVSPSEPAEKVSLLRRAKLDLLGLPPTIEEVTEFLSDETPDCFRRRLDRWLASPAYGERWARSWLELVRYCDTPESWSEVHHSHRYRDWVIQAMNTDMPYNRFATLQLAADQLPDAAPQDLAALGFIGLSPTYWKELQLPVEIIKSIVSDEYEERIHTWSSTFLGLNLACARCHDHKFDPITVQDYYALAGIFANSRLIDRSLEPGVDSLAIVEAHKQVKELEQQISKLEADHKKSVANLDKGPLTAVDLQKIDDQQRQLTQMRQRIAEIKQVKGFDGPMAPGVIDAKLEVLEAVGSHGSRIVYKSDLHDLAIEIRGNPNRTSTMVPRRYVAVLSSNDPRNFTQGSGRLELAQAMLRESEGLMARVVVNRIWRHHMGIGIVDTPSDFGTQGTPPTHPELLDDLAMRFIQSDWSFKWLHREIMLSATYQQSSRGDVSGEQFAHLYTRYPLRRLEVEAWRDAMLSVTGLLDHSLGGVPLELSSPQNARRTIYGTVKRRELTDLLRLHDFPDPITHSPNRIPTNTPLQQLFVLNSPFMQEQAIALVKRLELEVGTDSTQRIHYAYQLLFSRNPTADELALGLEYVQPAATASDWQQYAQTLLGCNEFLFLD